MKAFALAAFAATLVFRPAFAGPSVVVSPELLELQKKLTSNPAEIDRMWNAPRPNAPAAQTPRRPNTMAPPPAPAVIEVFYHHVDDAIEAAARVAQHLRSVCGPLADIQLVWVVPAKARFLLTETPALNEVGGVADPRGERAAAAGVTRLPLASFSYQGETALVDLTEMGAAGERLCAHISRNRPAGY